jgi:hypothetical protein
MEHMAIRVPWCFQLFTEVKGNRRCGLRYNGEEARRPSVLKKAEGVALSWTCSSRRGEEDRHKCVNRCVNYLIL